ncbi:nucleoside hydrolase (plasmid) [Pseudonocardia sp. EC080610-09]|uniref:nucleoside hydrolase n=1 Tax=Pseudonocardia sp. EC080610-09 TaxID=1688404 RepID=UPI000705D887|nr:nucleoside hydrolase [Pseudonocardia sp. EC080610-09]ALL79942.1 nucleoside hydrolase [Pseudonocardia sp. EC080610-09]
MTSRPEGDLSIDQVRAHRKNMIDVGRRLPGSPLAETAAQLRAAGLAEPLTRAPIIVDTDLGGDADDALALVAAARHRPDLALVLTADETGPEQGYGQRARFARHLLDTVGRHDVTVAAGATVGRTDYFCVADLIPAAVPVVHGGRDAVLAAVAEVAGQSEGPIRWVGMAPLSNLAGVCDHLPEIAARLQVTQMGGAIDYRRPERAEHNIRLDVDAARRVLAAVGDGRLAKPRFVISDVTFTDQIAVHAAHPLHQRLAAGSEPWARLLADHLDRWYAAHHASTLQHDALTLSAALGLPFVRAATTRVAMDEIGRWIRDEEGTALRLSRSADYPAFMTWLSEALDPAVEPAAAPATAAASSGVRRPA